MRDGGGIRPDIEPKNEEITTFLYYLVQDMAIFDFATQFRLENDTIAPADKFTISNEVYEEFKKYLVSTGFTYDLISAKVLTDLKEAIELEGLSEIVKEEIASLEAKLQTNLNHSLEHFDKHVRDLLADEIIKRYYGERGEIIYNLREDADMLESYIVIGNPERYSRILSPGNQ